MTKVRLKRLKPTVAYSASTIQQNHGEALKGHGLIEWNLEDLSYKAVDIENDYGYYTLEIEDSKIKNWSEDIPAKPRFRVRFKNTPIEDRKAIETLIRDRRMVAEWTIQIMDKTYGESPETISISNIRSLEYQNQLLEEFYPGHELLNQIREINKDVNSKVEDSYGSRNIIWKPINFEFSNMFSYGEDNYITFENAIGVYGIFGKNATGKSSVFNALSFCLFDRCSTTSYARDVLNRKKDRFWCKLEFDTNGKRYFIEKEGIKDSTGHVKVNINFYTFGDDGEEILLNGDQRSSTNKIIRDYVGTYEDFILTVLSAQSGGVNFVDKTQKERRDLLAQFIDINVFEDFYKIANEDFKETKVSVENLQKEDFAQKLVDANNTKIELEGKLGEHSLKLKDQEELLKKAEDIKEQLFKSLKPIENLPSSTQVLGQIDQYKKEIESKNNKLQILTTNTSLEDKKENLTTAINLIPDFSELSEKVSELSEQEKKLQEIDRQINMLEYSRNSLEKDIKACEEHKFDPNCEFCVKHPTVIKGQKAQEELKNIIDQINKLTYAKPIVEEKIKQLQLSRQLLEDRKQKELELSQIETQIVQKESIIKEVTNDLLLIKHNIKQKEELLQKIVTQQEDREFNNEVERKVGICQQKINEVKNDIAVINKSISDISGSISLQNFIIKNAEEKLNTLEELSKKYEAYKLYLSAVKSSGIPYKLIERILPEIQNRINEILNQIVDFEIKLESDGQTSINAYITYNHEKFWTLEGGSGMEKFISSLAIRTALINSTSLPKPNFICIDEGFGVLDSENLANIATLFEILKGQFESILCISHLEAMKDLVDNRIEVNKIDGFSQVIF